MRVIRMALLGALVLWVAIGAASAAEPKQNVAKLMVEGVKAVEESNPVVAKENFKAVLKQDPTNYHALVLMGQLEMDDLGGPDRVARMLSAEHYFLLASMAQPHRPEAYLGLAQLYFDTGYVDRGDRYARLAQQVEPESYEGFALIGQRFEDSGNFAGALDQYLRALEEFPFDVYLADKRYVAASRGGLQPYELVFYGLKGKVALHFLQPRQPDFDRLNSFRRESTHGAQSRERYHLPKFTFKFCPSEKRPERRYKDLYEAFIRASTSDPAQYRELRAKLDEIRKAALQAIAGVEGDRAKAKALYMWLKNNVLKKYHLKEGVLAQDVLTRQEYVCLNAAILFTLIGQEAGLPVHGMITDGHAFAAMDHGKRKIQIEMTAEPLLGMKPEDGFDVAWWDQFQQLNRVDVYGGLRTGSSSRNIGEVSPDELTAYQFYNAMVLGVDKIQQRHAADLKHKATLLDLQRQTKRESAARQRELAGQFRGDARELYRRVLKLRDKYEGKIRDHQREIDRIDGEFLKDLVEYRSTTGRDLIRDARALAPGNEELTDLEQSIFIAMAEQDLRPALLALRERAERREGLVTRLAAARKMRKISENISGKQSPIAVEYREREGSIEKDIKALNEAEKKAWSDEKTAWLTALKRLEKGLDEFPCSTRLRRVLEAYCWQIARLAESFDDSVSLSEVVRLGATRLPESEFAKHYQPQQLGSL